MRGRRCWIATAILGLLLGSWTGVALAEEPRRLVVLHTNDWQSRLLGFAPNRDYTPLTTGDDATIGGIARLATLIADRRAQDPDSTLLLDGGDIMMGTLFQTLGPKAGSELHLLGRLGYDAAVLGNHEFDFGPEILAQTVEAAQGAGPLPALLLANLVLDPEDPGDDRLAALVTAGVIQPSTLVERAGLTIGLFGLMGTDAADVASFAPPVRFSDPIETARRITAELREAGADVVFCLSHGGIRRLAGGGWGGEDPQLLRRVPGLDAVIGGHSHTPLHQGALIEGRPVVQAGSEGRYLGELVFTIEDGGVVFESAQLHRVDDQTPGDPEIHALVESVQQRIDTEVLAPYGLTFSQPLLQTTYDLRFDWHDPGASGLGPLVADALRLAAERSGQPDALAMTTAGLIRDHLLQGDSGIQQLSDLFRLLPLGIGRIDQSPGYPLLEVWMTGHEIKVAAEVLLFGAERRGANYFPIVAGLEARYHPWRPPLDRIYDIVRVTTDGERQALEADRLYPVVVSTYLYESFPLIGTVSHGLIRVEPKDATGEVITDPTAHLLDADPTTPGIQEVKEWMALVELAATFDDKDGDGIPELPQRYASPAPRLVADARWSADAFLGNSTWILRSTLAGPLVLLALLGWWRLRTRR